jgi:hypothetical protein
MAATSGYSLATLQVASSEKRKKVSQTRLSRISVPGQPATKLEMNARLRVCRKKMKKVQEYCPRHISALARGGRKQPMKESESVSQKVSGQWACAWRAGSARTPVHVSGSKVNVMVAEPAVTDRRYRDTNSKPETPNPEPSRNRRAIKVNQT